MKLSLFILIALFFNELSCTRDVVSDQLGLICGLPGHSLKSFFTPKQRIYRAKDTVKYSCENSDMVLIGPSKRTCLSGIWEKQSIPKCATKIAKSEAYIAGNVLVISTNKVSKISAVTITLIARKTTLSISKVKYLPEYTCNKTFGPEQDAFLPYSISFICKSNLVKSSQYTPGNFVVIFFTSEISCENDCSYKLRKDDDVDLYEISQDDCSKPDFPVYGHSRSWPRSRSAKGRQLNLNKDINANTTTTTISTTTVSVVTKTSSITPSTKHFYPNNKGKTPVKTTPLPASAKTISITASLSSTKSTSPIKPSTTVSSTTPSSSKLPPHFLDTIHSDITSSDTGGSSNETITESPIFSSDSTNSTGSNETQVSGFNSTKIETNKQKYFCNQHFKMNIEDSENFDEVMSMSRYAIKQFEKCEKGEDWQYPPRLPECIPEIYCMIPKFPDNVIPSYSNLYLNEYAIVHDEISFKCLHDDDINTGGNSQTCLVNGNWSGLPPRCVTKNSSSFSNSGIVYLSISVSLVSLVILVLAIYCAMKLNHTANIAVQAFNKQHQQLIQQNISAQSSLNSSLMPEGNYSASNYTNLYGQTINRQLPKVPSLHNVHIYDTVQSNNNVSLPEPRYVEFKTSTLTQDAKQQHPSTWNSIKRKLKKQGNTTDEDMNSLSYRAVGRDSCDFDGYDYIGFKTNDSVYKKIIIDSNLDLPKQSTFKTTNDTSF